MDRDQMRDQLKAMRRSLEAPFAAAKAIGDGDEMQRLEGIAGDIDDVLDELAMISLASLAASLTEIKNRIDKHAVDVNAAGNEFAGLSVAETKKRIAEIFADSAEEDFSAISAASPDPGPGTGAAAAPATPGGTAAETAAPSAAFAVPTPADGNEGRLMLSEAHLLALWKRSQFPVTPGQIVVFGLRGCRPVDFGGTDFAPHHEIFLATVNYKSMNCTLGQWNPGHGLAVFPGSTVPFGITVSARISANGNGVNQMGRGRYPKYTAGWHKRSEGTNGHWALLQDCPITAQRTGDDADFDTLDRWEVGRQFGDNIHCAFNMGVDGKIPDAAFSSAGCQTIAGTVKKGVRNSAAGPFRTFMMPFADKLGAQKNTEYVLFAADEAQTMIRSRLVGKTVILRMGSQGPLVRQLQDALNRRTGSKLTIDGDFGPPTFQAVIDFQTQQFGPDADDGIVGPASAAKLGFQLPLFDFDDAISGGRGYTPIAPEIPAATSGAGTAAAISAAVAAPTAAVGSPLAFGKVTRKKHGQEFNDKVIAISARLRCDPNHLMAVMAFETGESFSPAQKSAAGSSATGLIQFMPGTAIGLGTTIEKLDLMSGVTQLDFVEKHFESVVHSRAMPNLGDVYMAVLLPSALGQLDSHVLFQKPSRAYDQNEGLDVNRNGRVTKAEAAAKVQDKLVLGMKDNRFG